MQVLNYTYMENVATLGVGSTDIFIAQQPHASWTISTSAAQWEAPITQPTLTDDQIAAGSYYTWDEFSYQADTSDFNSRMDRSPLLNNHKEG